MGSYSAPSIGASGLVISPYSAYLNYLIQEYQAIYGTSVYLGTDSPDYQDISIRALQASDAAQGLQLISTALNPLTATGPSLDLIGQLIGTTRNAATYSTALVNITGTNGTQINNGVVQDVNGNYWNLPPTVIIPSSGSISVTATAQQLGNITANPGTITKISTPTAGWTAVTNAAAAVPGEAIEPDSAYRARLLISQAKPSLSLLAGTAAAVAAVSGVTRSQVYENPFGYTAGFGIVNTSGTAVTLVYGYNFDSSDVSQQITINGITYSIASVSSSTSLTLATSAGTQTSVPYSIGTGGAIGPAHSITCVVENGTSAAIAQAIYNNKNPGVLTNGTTTVTVVDPNNGGISLPISYDILQYSPIYVVMNVHGLTGFTSATQTAIQTAIVAYLNSLGIGESVIYSEICGAALNARPNPDQPLFSIKSWSIGSLAASTSATVTLGSPTITVASATGIANGQAVAGTGIPAGTTVSSISGTSITLSNNATAGGSGVAVYFFTLQTSDIGIAYNYASQGSSEFVVINQV